MRVWKINFSIIKGMSKRSETDILSQDIRKTSQRAFVELFRLLLEGDLPRKQEPPEHYKDNEKNDEHSRA